MLLAALMHDCDPQLLQTLIKLGADANYKELEALTLSSIANQGSFEAIKFLLDHGAKVKEVAEAVEAADMVRSSKPGGSLLYSIFKNGRLSTHHKKELVDILVREGLDINKTSYNGATLLHTFFRPDNANILLSVPGIEKSLFQMEGTSFPSTPWEKALVYSEDNIDIATRMIFRINAEDARKKIIKVERFDHQEMRPKESMESQIDRLKQCKGKHHWDKLKQAFIGIGIAEKEIEEATSS